MRHLKTTIETDSGTHNVGESTESREGRHVPAD